MDRHNDNEEDEHSKPGIPPPGKQLDQQQIPGAPPQSHDNRQNQGRSSSQWIPPTTGNPDLDPAGLDQGRRINLREPNPLVPQGMLYDPRQLTDHRRGSGGRDFGGMQPPPPGARFDPFGPPDPNSVGPGRGPGSSQYGVPDPDHFVPPGVQPPAPNRRLNPGEEPAGKSIKFPGGWPFPPPGGPGRGPFQ